LGILNSRLMDFIYSFVNPEKGEALAQVKKDHVENLLVPDIAKVAPEMITEITSLVDRILTVKRANPTADTAELETQLDTLVYQLYNLTPEEIKIVKEKQ